jgi:hypothetical protein
MTPWFSKAIENLDSFLGAVVFFSKDRALFSHPTDT